MLFNALGRAIGLAGKLNKGKGALGALRTVGNVADTATSAALLYGASQLPGSMRDEILLEGPNDPYNEKNPTAFKLSLPQQAVFGLNNLVSGALGGKQITADSLSTDYRNRSRKDILENRNNRELMIEAGIKTGDIRSDIYSQAQLDEFLVPKVKTARARKELADTARAMNINVSPNDTIETLQQKINSSPLSKISQFNLQRSDIRDRQEFEKKIYQNKIEEDRTRRRQELELALAQLGNQSARDKQSNQLAIMQLQNLAQKYDMDNKREDRRAQQQLYTTILRSLENLRSF